MAAQKRQMLERKKVEERRVHCEASTQQVKILTPLGSDEDFQIPERLFSNMNMNKRMLYADHAETVPPLRAMMAKGQISNR